MVLPRTYDSQNCSVARSLEVVGDRWTMLVIRTAFEGVRRFDDYQDALGIARNVLTDRLTRLCDEGILRKVPYQERPDRYEYRLTRKGVELWPAMMVLMRWGDRHYAPAGPPVIVAHAGCGGVLGDDLSCDACGKRLQPDEVETRPGPGAGL
ncbi:winged helix-turn-helix transcriptional regulator [Actinomadura rugatobispora]|uniref:Winged helix-turn-helix transcriptional regulator n=1 Tax=Actinomadura rugatobispora TaxID=1994 RepID=A0ABW0ZWS6_9ACTN|nr:helix-turn-helix domain-containing protein [Actinomadura rugatobispora]